jgi:hypothetical protein
MCSKIMYKVDLQYMPSRFSLSWSLQFLRLVMICLNVLRVSGIFCCLSSLELFLDRNPRRKAYYSLVVGRQVRMHSAIGEIPPQRDSSRIRGRP